MLTRIITDFFRCVSMLDRDKMDSEALSKLTVTLVPQILEC